MSENKEENKCDLCGGSGVFMKNQCTYCNGTGEWNFAAQSYVENHICQCIVLDRKFCPICGKHCHHDTSLDPKQTIDSGFGGQSTSFKNWDKQEREMDIESPRYA